MVKWRFCSRLNTHLNALGLINVDLCVTRLLSSWPMSSLVNLTVLQLQQALQIKEQIESLQRELQQIEGTQANGFHPGSARRTISAAGRRRIAEAQSARWAKQKVSTPEAPKAKRKSSMSAAGRARIAAAQRRRWARVKATKS
jgi:hypothetical protein